MCSLWRFEGHKRGSGWGPASSPPLFPSPYLPLPGTLPLGTLSQWHPLLSPVALLLPWHPSSPMAHFLLWHPPSIGILLTVAHLFSPMTSLLSSWHSSSSLGVRLALLPFQWQSHPWHPLFPLVSSPLAPPPPRGIFSQTSSSYGWHSGRKGDRVQGGPKEATQQKESSAYRGIFQDNKNEVNENITRKRT